MKNPTQHYLKRINLHSQYILELNSTLTDDFKMNHSYLMHDLNEIKKLVIQSHNNSSNDLSVDKWSSLLHSFRLGLIYLQNIRVISHLNNFIELKKYCFATLKLFESIKSLVNILNANVANINNQKEA